MTRLARQDPLRRKADNRKRNARRKRARLRGLAEYGGKVRHTADGRTPIELIDPSGDAITLVPGLEEPRGDILRYVPGTALIVGLTDFAKRRGWQWPAKEDKHAVDP